MPESVHTLRALGCAGRVSYLPVFSTDFNREYSTLNSKLDPLTAKKR